MVSQRDKSADLFALTTRSLNCFQGSPEQIQSFRAFAFACSPKLLRIQKKRTATGTTARAAIPVRQLRAEARFAFPWRGRSVNAQVRAGAADGASSEGCETGISNFQVQPNEQPSAEGFGAEAA